MILSIGTCLGSCPSTQSGPEFRPSLRILGTAMLCMPPWNMSETVAANFLQIKKKKKKKEGKYASIEIEAGGLVLSVGGLK